MDELNENVPTEESMEQEHALKCEENETKQNTKTPALFKAGIALMCATSALSLGAIGACGFLGYKLYKNQKNSNSKSENSMGSVVTNKQDTITISSDGYWVINGVKTSTKAKAENGTDGLSVVSATVVKDDKWGIASHILFVMSDGTSIPTSPQTQILSEHYYEASTVSDFITLKTLGVSNIKLTNDINLSSQLEISGDFSINLNRNTLTYSSSKPITVNEESSLTFKNGSLALNNETGVSVKGSNSELTFEKVNISASAVVAETLEENVSITLDDCSFQASTSPMFGSSRNSSIGSLFVVKGANANLNIKSSKFDTTRAIVSATENATAINVKIEETEIKTSAPILDIDTDVVIPTLDVDQNTINNSTITELNTSPITSGSFNVDPTELGATLEGVEQFNVNGSTVLATDLEALVEMVEAGSTINLTKNYILESNIVITKTLTINLGSHIISAPHNEDLAVLQVEGKGKLTINATEEGGINSASDSNDCSIAVWARNGGEVIINGGFYTNVGALSNLGNNKFANNEMIYTSGNGSKITINDGFFMGNFLNEKWGTRYTLNKHDSTDSEIVVNGGFFFGYNPAESQSEYPVENFVGENKLVGGFYMSIPGDEPGSIGFEGMIYGVTSSNNFEDVVKDGITLYEYEDPYYGYQKETVQVSYIYLNGNVVLERGIVIENRELTLNLNTHTISAPTSTSTALIRVNANGYLTIEGNGTINSASSANDYSIAVWACNGGQVVINGGTFTNLGAKDFEDNGTTPNNNELIYVNGSGSLITINNATIIGNSENKTWGTRYTLNKQDKCNSEIIVNGGTFVKYDPSMSQSENPIANFVNAGHLIIKTGENYTVIEGTLADAITNAVAGSTIILTEDITLTDGVVVTKELTLNLGNYTISTPTIDELAAIEVNAGGKLTINADEEGMINSASQNNDCSIAVWARNGGEVIINGGFFTNVGALSNLGNNKFANNEMIYTSGNGSKITINDGWFMGNYENEKWGTRYTLNKHDSTNSTIIVNGGYFFNYNPEASLSENPVANFVAEGKIVVRFDEVTYAVVSSDYLAEALNNEDIDYVSLHSNIVLNSGVTISRNLTLNLNNYTITAPHSASTALFKVESNGVLTIEGNGTINSTSDANDYSMAVWAKNGGQVVINGGTFTNVGAKDFEDNGVTPNNNELIYVSGSGSLITINAGTFIGNSENRKWGTRYTLNKQDGCASEIVVNGGTFVAYDPTMSQSENPIANFVTKDYLIYKVGNNYTVAPETELINILNNNAGATIILTSSYIVSGEVTINLNGCTITAPHSASTALFLVDVDSILTINGEGIINSASDSNDYSMAVWARNGGQVVINGGTFTNLGGRDYEVDEKGNLIIDDKKANNNELIYVSGSGSLITINAGTFIGNSENRKWGTRYTLNKQDGCASEIVVNGGTFVAYDPSMSQSENPIANFVTNGNLIYIVDNKYTVAPVTNLVEVINNNAGATIILQSGIVVTSELTLNLNGCTITAPHSASTALFRVETNGVLTINGEGIINSASDSNDYSMAVWARNGGQVVINGGTFTNLGGRDYEVDEKGNLIIDDKKANNNELIYVSGSGSLITINAGTFIGNSENRKWGTRYTLNKQDGCASEIVVNGGTFVAYDPTMSQSENPIANFVAEGYKVVVDGNNYTVVAE